MDGQVGSTSPPPGSAMATWSTSTSLSTAALRDIEELVDDEVNDAGRLRIASAKTALSSSA